MAKMIEVAKKSVHACRAWLMRFSLMQKVVGNANTHGSDACGSESNSAASSVVARQLTTYYCSDWSLFVEWGREREMEIISGTARIVYSKRSRPETYPTVVRFQN